jgi:hypothetical protein
MVVEVQRKAEVSKDEAKSMCGRDYKEQGLWS